MFPFCTFLYSQLCINMADHEFDNFPCIFWTLHGRGFTHNNKWYNFVQPKLLSQKLMRSVYIVHFYAEHVCMQQQRRASLWVHNLINNTIWEVIIITWTMTCWTWLRSERIKATMAVLWSSSPPSSKHCVIAAIPPPSYITIGVWWNCFNDTSFWAWWRQVSQSLHGGLKATFVLWYYVKIERVPCKKNMHFPWTIISLIWNHQLIFENLSRL